MACLPFGWFDLLEVHTDDNVADIFTKAFEITDCHDVPAAKRVCYDTGCGTREVLMQCCGFAATRRSSVSSRPRRCLGFMLCWS